MASYEQRLFYFGYPASYKELNDFIQENRSIVSR